MTYPCTVYHRPHGRPEQIEVQHIKAADADWFREHSVRLSMEDDGAGGAICYADIGLKDDDGQPDELIEFSKGRNCQDTLAALRQKCETTLKEHP